MTIHPFVDGNGRTSRLIMNLILWMNGYTIAILKGDQESKLSYFNALESVQVDRARSFYRLLIDRVKIALEECINLLTPLA